MLFPENSLSSSRAGRRAYGHSGESRNPGFCYAPPADLSAPISGPRLDLVIKSVVSVCYLLDPLSEGFLDGF
jgi:hypothetical protein